MSVGPTPSARRATRKRKRNGSSQRPALGRDPFVDTTEVDPFLLGLSALAAEDAGVARGRARRSTVISDERSTVISDEDGELLEAAGYATPAALHGEPLRVRDDTRPLEPEPHRWVDTPPVDQIELPEPEGILGLIESLVPEDERRHVAALMHLVEGDGLYDRFGFSPEVTRRAFPYLYALYRLYFRVESEGHDHLPLAGPAILAGNHGGLLPFDGAMVVTDTLLHTDPPRLPRSIVDLWAGALPFVNVFYARVGQVIGTRENMSELLDQGQLLLVFPEGMDGVRKTIAQRYTLQRFHVGFVEQALLSGAPIVPVAIIGNDDQTPILYDVKWLAKRLGLPAFPITPTFPWLGPAGLLPYPVSYKIHYGEPIELSQHYGPNDAENPQLVQHITRTVRHAVQKLLDRNR